MPYSLGLLISLPLGIRPSSIFCKPVNTPQPGCCWLVSCCLVFWWVVFYRYCNSGWLKTVNRICWLVRHLNSATEYLKSPICSLIKCTCRNWWIDFSIHWPFRRVSPRYWLIFHWPFSRSSSDLFLLTIYSPYFIILGLAVAILWLITRFSGPEAWLPVWKKANISTIWCTGLKNQRLNRSLKIFNYEISSEKTDGIVSNYIQAREKHFPGSWLGTKLFIGFKLIVAAGLLILGGILVFRAWTLVQFVAAEIIILLILNSVEKVAPTIDVIYDVLTALENWVCNWSETGWRQWSGYCESGWRSGDSWGKSWFWVSGWKKKRSLTNWILK